MLPFASPCFPDNIIPISEASNRNLQFFFVFSISTLCASLLKPLPQSTCLIKLSPEFRAVSIRGVTFWLKQTNKETKTETTKTKTTKKATTTTTPRYRLYHTVVTKEGTPYILWSLSQTIADLRQREPQSEQYSSCWVSLKVLHRNVKLIASKSYNKRRQMAALAAELDKKWVALESHGQEPAVDSLFRHARLTVLQT